MKFAKKAKVGARIFPAIRFFISVAIISLVIEVLVDRWNLIELFDGAPKQTSALQEATVTKDYELSPERSSTPNHLNSDRMQSIYDELANIKNTIVEMQNEYRDFRRLHSELLDMSARLSYIYSQQNFDSDLPEYNEQQQDSEFAAQNNFREREHKSNLEKKFDKEGVDEEFSSDSLSFISNALAMDEFQDTSITELDCRTSICRLSVEHADPRALLSFQSELPSEISERFSRTRFFYEHLAGGRVRSVIYMIRNGGDF